MDIGPRHEIVFLNELHDRIRRGHVQDGPGFFRIMGRLVEYDPYTQIAKVQSCFHQQYPPETPLTEDDPEVEAQPPLSTADCIDLISSESEAEQEDLAMLASPQKPASNGSPVQNSTTSSSATMRQEGVIDLTLDAEDEVDEIEYTQPGETSFWNTPDGPPQGHRKSVRLSLDLEGRPESRRVDRDHLSRPSMDKGKQRAESRYEGQDRQASRSTDLNGKKRKSGDVDQDHQAPPNSEWSEWKGKQRMTQKGQSPPLLPPPAPRTAPMMQLLVDTQLLGSRIYDLRALFEFSGQVVFDPDLEDDSSLNVGSRARSSDGGPQKERPGRWVMMAKSARNMEGLNLYAYRESVLRIRELMAEDSVGSVTGPSS